MARTKGIMRGYLLLGILCWILMAKAVPTEACMVDGHRSDGLTCGTDNALRSTARITLEPSASCFHAPAPGNIITINIWVRDLPQVIQGGQFFLGYDNTVLDFVNADPAPTVFTLEVYESVDEGAGTIDYASGVPLGPPNAMPYPNHILAVLKFQLAPGHNEACDIANLIWFRAHTPPTRLTTTTSPLIVPTVDLGGITVDNTPPTIAPPASNQSVMCDGAGNTVQFNNWLNSRGGAMATDNCGVVTWSNNYDAGHWVTGAATRYVSVMFTATDGCGNASTTAATFTIVDATLGDMNCDCALSVSDIGPFVLALTDPVGYATAYPFCNILLADMNADGLVDGADIEAFVNGLLAGS